MFLVLAVVYLLGAGCSLRESPPGYIEVRVVLHPNFINRRKDELKNTPFFLTPAFAYISTVGTDDRGRRLSEGKPTYVAGGSIEELQNDDVYVVNVEGILTGRIPIERSVFSGWDGQQNMAHIHLNDNGTIMVEWVAE